MADLDWIKNPNVQQALVFFQRNGWSPQQATGIVSNLWHEGLRDPDNHTGDGGKAYGVGQWHPDRQQVFQGWMGKPITDSMLLDQLGFVEHELTEGKDVQGRRARLALQRAQTPADAAAIFMKGFERPSDPYGAEAFLRDLDAEDLHNAMFGTAS